MSTETWLFRHTVTKGATDGILPNACGVGRVEPVVIRGLHGRSRWRLAVLMGARLLAGGQRTVTSWLRAAAIGKQYRAYYEFPQPLGKGRLELGRRVLMLPSRTKSAPSSNSCSELQSKPSRTQESEAWRNQVSAPR